MRTIYRNVFCFTFGILFIIGRAQSYLCNDGSTIDDEKECDFTQDCPDGGDESTCSPMCSFEDNQCDWYNEDDTSVAELQWTMFTNNEQKWYQGPAVDHTLNSVKGHFYYIDNTISEKTQRAFLRSPVYSLAARSCTFSFWYFVYGIDFGTLKVWQYTPGNDRSYTLMVVHDRSVDESLVDKWTLAEIRVEACAEEFQLSIEAVDKFDDGQDSGGYAIDDLQFTNCAYSLPNRICDAVTEGTCDSGHCYPVEEKCDFTYNCCDGTDESFTNCADHSMCDFEEGFCDWEQLSDDMADWTRHRGSTGTGSTGPWIDHTTLTSNGYYIYTEADLAQPGDTFRLGSYYIKPSLGDCQIRFYHYIVGSGIGELRVRTRTQIGGPMTTVWMRDTPHEGYWAYESLALTSPDAFQAIFEVVRGTTNAGDIALDDISFTPACFEYTEALPPADVTPTPSVNCPSGQRPCDIEGCIDEDKYCDFINDCPVGGEDEKYCPDFCNFDTQGDTNLCYWSQDVKDDFDWSWFNTADMDESFQGPRIDHTTQTTSGHYIYVDGSSSALNTYAKLISPVYKKSARSCTFGMWYYMFGVEYGDLEVRLITQDGMDVRLTKVGDNVLDYNKWILSESSIPACTTNFQIVIEVEDKQRIPAESGFAVDDVSFTDCAYPYPVGAGECRATEAQCDSLECYPSENQCDFVQDCCDNSDENRDTCTQLGYSLCDFEDDLCFWTQLTSDEFDWVRHHGDTGSEGTGPKEDHTKGTSEGYYIYTEASNPMKLGERAKLASFSIQGSALNVCTMRFFYHMRGTGIGNLNVYYRTTINGPLTNVWTMARDQGNIWISQSLDFRSSDDFQIIIEGTIGTTTDGDIALDDISLTPNCVPAETSIPSISTPPPSQIPCPTGQLPCNLGCIDESKYCDFRHDCLPGEEDEAQCPVFCDFETDLCYWTQDRTDDFDWTRYNQDEDPNAYMGPEVDHTTGAATGHYIYVDGSISSQDTRAKLISPMYKKSRRGCVFTLWYYMFGVEYGDLEVRLVTQDGDDYRLTKAFDGLSDYNKWQIHVTEIPPCSTNFQVVVDAEDRQVVPSEGGFAVDDMMFQNCVYPEPSASCGIGEEQCATGECYPASQQCDFTSDCCDNSDEQRTTCNSLGYSMCDFDTGMCDWVQLETDEFDWTWRKGPTSSDDTGPSSDHTTGNGYYLYTEASNPMKNGDRAKLASFTITQTVTGLCSLRFFYHMNGKGIGTLNIYTRTAINGPMTLLWTKERSVGGLWVYETLPIRNTDNFQIIIEGVIGYTIESDIAIDDVSLTPECEPSANTLPELTTPLTDPATARRTITPCRSGNFYCTADRSCIADELLCNGVNDCSDGVDEEGCPSEYDNSALVIGLSVTFSLLFIVGCGAAAFFLYRSRQAKKSEPNLVGASFSQNVTNPGYAENKNSKNEVAFTMDRSDA